MMTNAFETFLFNEPCISSKAAVTTRLRQAEKAEEYLNTSLDVIVSDDDRMYEALVALDAVDSDRSRMQNAVRKYYKFKNQKEFPRLRNYHSAKHP